uniref:Fe2OG dioxygenase domain-containing protein n=1 Tax=Chlamydomonas euryale TaxID=1486919 RepID=A0A7R9YQ36_9CHLO|mmetsp:Transcript_10020/g.30229  ORF Transcript_10020/g.30229 Transcript_10020/m.30229 type:complete len:316 (+) Transcript_10020:323-1270(+)
MLQSDVPVIDMSLPEPEAAAAMRAACVGPGFFYVSNHGVDGELVDLTFDRTRSLFALPLEEKQRLLQDKNNRGWTPFQEETLDPANQTCGDTKEGFYFGREIAADSPEASKPLHGPNQWPDEALVPGLRDAYTRYFNALWALGTKLLRLVALALDLPPDHFDPHFQQPIVSLRPLHYSGTKSAPGDGVFGAGAHTDYGMLTILKTDEVPGLQIHTSGAWRDVPPMPGAFIINLGDMLERWTNGMFHSTLHRVVNTTGQERYSIAFFFEPNFEAIVECLPQCCGPDRPPKYPPTTAGQHLLDKYAATHAGYSGPTA